MARNYLERERRGHTLQPTALVHESFLRLVDLERVRWANRLQFFGFGGLELEEVAQLLEISTATVSRRWKSARAWLYNELRTS